MKNSVVIKANNSGIIVVLDPFLTFEELKEKVALKFKESAAWFGSSQIVLAFRGRELTNEQQQQLLDVINENSELQVMCLLDEETQSAQVFEEVKKKIMEEILSDAQGQMEEMPEQTQQEPLMAPAVEPEPPEEKGLGSTGMFIKGNMRSGEEFETEHSVVILGDVNNGATVVSGGNIVVLGALKGNAYAGVPNHENAFVAALSMEPVQLRIGQRIARGFSGGKRKELKVPKAAFVKDGEICIGEISRDVVNSIHLDEMKKNKR